MNSVCFTGILYWLCILTGMVWVSLPGPTFPCVCSLFERKLYNCTIVNLCTISQFRLAYFGPSSGIGSGPLIDEPKQIVGHYLLGWFFLDLVVVLPLPQVCLWNIIDLTGICTFWLFSVTALHNTMSIYCWIN